MSRATEALEHSREAAERAGDSVGVARCSANLAYLLGQQAQYAEAEQAAREALKSFEELQMRPGVVLSRINVAMTYLNQGLWTEALEHYDIALSDAEEATMVQHQIEALNGMSEAHRQMGSLVEAERRASEALALALQVGDPFEQANSHINLGDCAADQQQAAQAEQHWSKAEELYTQTESDGVEDARARLAGRKKSPKSR